MSENLIPVVSMPIGAATVQTVNARELHAFLEVGTAFKDWISRRVSEYGFAKDVDFVSSFLSVEGGGDGRAQYHLSLDMAKELSMVERNARGKQARQYFIACEKRLIARQEVTPALPNFSDPVAAARAWADEVEAKRTAERALEQAKPAVEFVEKYVEAATGNKTFRQVCKLLGANEKRFKEFLLDRDVIYYLNGEMTPRSNHLDAGRFSVKAGVSNRSEHAYNHMTFTPKGVTWIAGEWGKHIVDLNQRVSARGARVLSHVHH